MYISQFSLVRYLVLCSLLQIITFVAIFSSADELGEFLSTDEEVAFGVGEGQKPVKVKAATATESKELPQNQEGYVMYCPCMGKFSVFAVSCFVLE